MCAIAKRCNWSACALVMSPGTLCQTGLNPVPRAIVRSQENTRNCKKAQLKRSRTCYVTVYFMSDRTETRALLSGRRKKGKYACNCKKVQLKHLRTCYDVWRHVHSQSGIKFRYKVDRNAQQQCMKLLRCSPLSTFLDLKTCIIVSNTYTTRMGLPYF